MMGQNTKYIQEQMGHASFQMTMDLYGHLFKTKDNATYGSQQAELLEGVLNSVTKPLENEAEKEKGLRF